MLDPTPRACVALALAMSLGGCGTPAQTVLRFDAAPGLTVPEGATIAIEVWGQGVRQHEQGQLRGPFAFTPDIKLVVDALDDDADRRFTVFAELRDPGGTRVSWARVRTGFVADRLSEVRIHFAAGCLAPPDRVEQNAGYDPELACASHETCVAGECASPCYAPEPFGGAIAVASAPVDCPERDCLAIDRVVAGWDNTCALSDGEAFCWGRTSFRDRWHSRPSRILDTSLRARPGEPVADLAMHVHHVCTIDPAGALRCGGSGGGESTVALTDYVMGFVPCCGAEPVAPPFSSIVTGGGWIAGVTTGEGEIWYTGAHPVSGGIAGEDGGPFRAFRGQTGFEVVYAGRNFLAGFQGDALAWFDRATPPALSRSAERQVAAAGRTLCAISEAEGRLRCWGESADRMPYATEPADLGAGFTRVALSSHIADDGTDPIPQHRCATRDDGSLICWGSNSAGQIGIDPAAMPSVPEGEGVRVGALDDWIDAAVGRAHTCGVHADGSLSCWGSAQHGQLGTGGASTFEPAAVCVPAF